MTKFQLKALFLLILVAGCMPALAQTQGTGEAPASLLSFSLTPSLSIPIGGDTSYFSVGGGGLLSAEYRLPWQPLVALGASVGYSYLPLKAGSSLSLPQVELDAGIHYDVAPSFALRVRASGGFAYGHLDDGSGSGSTPFVGVGADLGWNFSPTLGLVLGGVYRYYVDLYNEIAVTLGMSYRLVATGQAPKAQNQPAAKPAPLQSPPASIAPAGKGVTIKDLTLKDIFPILHTYYDNHPVGSLALKNMEDSRVSGVSVSLIVPQFMEAPKLCASIDELKPGEERRVDLFALFKNNVFDVKQSTKVQAKISVSYTLNDTPLTLEQVETLRVYDRNALTWDDTNKAAAFVMPKEPAVLMLSNKINSFVQPKISRAIDPNLQTAMGMHDALRLMGVAYVAPPLTSYAVVSQNKSAVDSVKFPLETIEYGSGDCSDLSVLYCSLLESVQVETAFITIPGHIFMAFALASSEDNVRKTYTHTDEFIFREGKAWVPVEVTERKELFLAAWQLGAKEWRENLAKNQADFYPVRTAWDTYEPVNYPGIGNQPTVPDQEQVVRDLQSDVGSLVAREISDKETALLASLRLSNNSPTALNALGVLYARYDLQGKAETQFQAAVKSGEYAPALVNLGNLRLLSRKYEEALAFYQRAATVAPKNALAILGLARANHELQNYWSVSKEYDQLKALDPGLASQFAYLRLQGEEATRAAEAANVVDLMVWGEER